MNRTRAHALRDTTTKVRVGSVTSALRSFWTEPAAANPPRLARWEWALAAALVIAVLLETALRDDLVWRPVALVFGLGLAGAVLVRRARPLEAVAFSFGTFALLAAATFLAGTEPLVLHSAAAILDAFAYSLFRWGPGREIVIGSGFITAGVVAIPATDPTDATAGVAVVLFSAVLGLWVRSRGAALVDGPSPSSHASPGPGPKPDRGVRRSHPTAPTPCVRASSGDDGAADVPRLLAGRRERDLQEPERLELASAAKGAASTARSPPAVTTSVSRALASASSPAMSTVVVVSPTFPLASVPLNAYQLRRRLGTGTP